MMFRIPKLIEHVSSIMTLEVSIVIYDGDKFAEYCTAGRRSTLDWNTVWCRPSDSWGWCDWRTGNSRLKGRFIHYPILRRWTGRGLSVQVGFMSLWALGFDYGCNRKASPLIIWLCHHKYKIQKSDEVSKACMRMWMRECVDGYKVYVAWTRARQERKSSE